MRIDWGQQFTNPIHHDLFKRGGWVYTIESTTETIDGIDYVIDGVYVFDASGAEVDTVRDFYLLLSESRNARRLGLHTGGRGPRQTNAIFVDEAGDLWLSFRHLQVFAEIRGGPGTPEFGELLWTAVGDPISPIVE